MAKNGKMVANKTQNYLKKPPKLRILEYCRESVFATLPTPNLQI
jgi:hypothetical protein